MKNYLDDVKFKPNVLIQFPPRYETDELTGEKVLRMPIRDWCFTIYKTVDPDGF